MLLIADAAGVFRTIGTIVAALLALMVMIIVHELGHYLVGKKLKFKINEFAIGFGPPIFKRTMRSGEQFSIRPIPLGGFCAFEGEDKDIITDGAFNQQAPWKRILVLLAGVTFNFLSAILILTVAFMAFGYSMPSVAGFNTPVDPAFEQNFEEGDVILKINGKNVYAFMDWNVQSLVTKSDPDNVAVLVSRDGEKVEITAKISQFLDSENETYTGLGINTGAVMYRYNIFQSIWRSLVFCFQLIVFLFQTLGSLFTGALAIKGNVGGTITTIAVMSTTVGQAGFRGLLMLFGMMSASIAIMNVLPLPALDGSRVIFTVIEWIRKKPINRKVEGMIHTVGLFVLFGITILFDLLNIGFIASLF